jgi:hypothetical protein
VQAAVAQISPHPSQTGVQATIGQAYHHPSPSGVLAQFAVILMADPHPSCSGDWSAGKICGSLAASFLSGIQTPGVNDPSSLESFGSAGNFCRSLADPISSGGNASEAKDGSNSSSESVGRA